MKKKISIVLSSITACAIIASLFAVNAYTGRDAKVQSDVATVSNAVQAYKVPSSEVTNNVKAAATDANSPATTSDTKVVNVNTANVNSGNNETCTTTTKPQNSNNQQTNIQSANPINNLQNAINNADCNKTTAKTNNYSALKTKLDAMLSRLSANTPTTNTTTAKTNTCTPATCTTDAKTTTCTPATCTATTKTTTCTPATCTTAKKPTTSTPATNTTVAKPTTSKSTTNTTAAKPTTSTPATSTSTNGDYSAFQNKVLELVNVERAKNGLKPLTMNANLSKTATLKSQDMAKLNYFSHTSPTYGSPFDMMKKYGISYRTAGENIAMGQTTPEQVMQGWMNSPGHRANILNSSFTQLGVGVAKNSNGQLYWTQQFIG